MEKRGAVGVYRTCCTPFAHQACPPQPVVFTTGIGHEGEHWLIASSEWDVTCRRARVPKARLT